MIVPEHTLKKTPVIIATGFTAAYLGDERTLREFIVGDYFYQTILQKGENAILYLINDSYDPLNYYQLKVATNKNEKLMKEPIKYCGFPIAEVPDPFNCHSSYSEHFIDALMQRLHKLDIHPVVLDTYNAYRAGHYSKYITTTFEQYSEINQSLAQSFESYSLKNLFRVQCVQCAKLDKTYILNVREEKVSYECHHCHQRFIQKIDEIFGKLSWKIDCAARWNIYDIDMEAFSKSHIHELGSLAISQYMSEHFFNGKVPEFINYGMVRIDRDMSYKLLEIMPPQMLKEYFLNHISKDIIINKDAVLNFSRKFHVRPSTNYIDFVAQELPHLAIQDKHQMEKKQSSLYPNLDIHTLIEYANRYSRFYFNKEHKLMLPDANYILSQDCKMAQIALDILKHALALREQTDQYEQLKSEISLYLKNCEHKSKVSPYLRNILGQTQGPTISTLLATLPYEHIKLTYMMLSFYINQTDSKLQSKPDTS